MTYTPDTNAIAAILCSDRVFVGRVADRLNRGDKTVLNAVFYFERKLSKFQDFANLIGVLPLDMAALDTSSSIYRTLRERETLVEDADILIAGRALANDATLVTHNLKRFERVEGLRLESWEVGEA